MPQKGSPEYCFRVLATAGIAVLAAVLALAGLAPFGGGARAQDGPIRVMSSEVSSEFPQGIRFRLSLESDNSIDAVSVRFQTGTEPRKSYDYLDLEESGDLVDGDLLWRTNTTQKFIPPGTLITYNFEIEDTEGNRLDTEPEGFVYRDTRFEWEEVEEGAVTVAYHGPVKQRAELILEAMTQTLAVLGPLLGADITEPIRVTMYNNRLEMLEALPPGSTTIRRELITEGQAFANIGTLLVLGSGRLARGTASHEMTHILTHRAGDSAFRSVPAWLDEGLAEYGNVDPSLSYTVAVEFAIETDRMLPITSMPVLPGDPEDVIIFYGQSRSIVRFMVGVYGPQPMTELMRLLKSGEQMDDALRATYGVNRLGLENQWRDAIGAPLLEVDVRERARPTPIARPTVSAYNLSDLISGSQATPTAEPTPTPEPAATPTAAVVAEAAPPPTVTAEPDPAEQDDTGGGACSRPSDAGPRGVDGAAVALGLGVLGLALGRRLRR